jgi:hypothetical protein
VDTDSGPLRDYYNEVQALLNHMELRETERSPLEKKRETTIRLLFFQSNIRGKFQQTYGDMLTAGFAALKLDVPNFALLNRKEALAVIREFETKANASSSAAARRCLPLLTEGLRDLDPKYIPANWI